MNGRTCAAAGALFVGAVFIGWHLTIPLINFAPLVILIAGVPVIVTALRAVQR